MTTAEKTSSGWGSTWLPHHHSLTRLPLSGLLRQSLGDSRFDSRLTSVGGWTSQSVVTDLLSQVGAGLGLTGIREVCYPLVECRLVSIGRVPDGRQAGWLAVLITHHILVVMSPVLGSSVGYSVL
jgi:hypothetical protein